MSATTKYKKAENWHSEDNFLVVLETSNLKEIEFLEYCSKKGLYPEQVKEWKEACMQANGVSTEKVSKVSQELKQERKEKEKLQKECLREKKKHWQKLTHYWFLEKRPMRFGDWTTRKAI